MARRPDPTTGELVDDGAGGAGGIPLPPGMPTSGNLGPPPAVVPVPPPAAPTMPLGDVVKKTLASSLTPLVAPLVAGPALAYQTAQQIGKYTSPSEPPPAAGSAPAIAPAPPGGPAVAPTSPPVGPDVQKTAKWEQGTQQAQATANEAGARRDLGESFDKQAEAVKAKTGAETDKAATEAALAIEDQKRVEQQLAEADQKRQVQRKLYDDAQAELAAQTEAHKKLGITDYFEDKPTGSLVLAALWQGIGAFAASLSGGPNHAMQIYKDAMARDRQLQLDRIAKSAENVANAKGNVGAARDAIEIGEVEIANRHKDLVDSLMLERRKRLAAHGMTDAQIAGDAQLAELTKLRAQEAINYETGLRRLVTKHAGGSVTTDNTRANAASGGAGHIVYGPGGEQLFAARDEKEAKEAGDRVATLRNLIDLTNQLEANLKEGPAFGPKQEQRTQLQRQIALEVKEAKKLGALDKGSLEVTNEIVPDSYGMGSGPGLVAKFRTQLLSEAAKKFDSYGVNGSQVLQRLQGAGQAALPRSVAPQVTSVELATLAKAKQSAKPGSAEWNRITAAQEAIVGRR